MNPYQQYVEWVIIVGMAGFVMFIMKQHREERDQWQKLNERQQDETNRNVRENTNILSALKTLIETLRK